MEFQKREAVELLKRSREEGRWFVGNFRLDWDLVNLKGYEPFEDLIRPKSYLKD